MNMYLPAICSFLLMWTQGYHGQWSAYWVTQGTMADLEESRRYFKDTKGPDPCHVDRNWRSPRVWESCQDESILVQSLLTKYIFSLGYFKCQEYFLKCNKCRKDVGNPVPWKTSKMLGIGPKRLGPKAALQQGRLGHWKKSYRDLTEAHCMS
jgi:hypothetical protein